MLCPLNLPEVSVSRRKRIEVEVPVDVLEGLILRSFSAVYL